MKVATADAWRVTDFLEPGRRGPWTVEGFTVTRQDAILQFGDMKYGRHCPPGDYTRLVHDSRGVVMSDTRAELMDLLPLRLALRQATDGDTVLIHGLGLGCALKGVLSCEAIARVDVVEIDPDVLDLVATQFAEPRIVFHHGDAFTKEWDRGARWSFIWHDVWDTLTTSNLSDEEHAHPGTYAKLHRKFGRRCRWQGSWGHDFLKAQQRRDREWSW